MAIAVLLPSTSRAVPLGGAGGEQGREKKYGLFSVPPGAWVATGVSLAKGQSFRVVATGVFKYKEHPFTEFGPNGNVIGNHVLKAKIGKELINVGASGGGTAAAAGKLELGAPHREKLGEGEEAGLDPAYKFSVTVYVGLPPAPKKEVAARFAIRQNGKEVTARPVPDFGRTTGSGTVYADDLGRYDRAARSAAGAIHHVDERTVRADVSVDLKVTRARPGSSPRDEKKRLELEVIVVKASPAGSCRVGSKGTVDLLDNVVGTFIDVGDKKKRGHFDEVIIDVCSHTHFYGNSFDDPDGVRVVLKGSLFGD